LKGDGSVLGDVDFAAGSKLAVDYNGSAVDSLTIGGALDIANATVDFNNLGGSLTTGAHVFATYASLVGGSFTSVVDLPAGFSIDYNYLGGNQIALVGGPAFNGDVNGDGDVDGQDFLAWQRGQSPTPLGAGDLTTWRNAYGAGASAAAAAAVPEPSVGMLAIIALAAIATARARPS
jgi:hypothetical protein